MMHAVRGLMRRFGSQQVARTNAAQASVRLQHRRRQADDDIEAYLSGNLVEPTAPLDPPRPGVRPTR